MLSLKEAKELVHEEFINNIMTNLDSSIICTYILNLEKENKRLEEELSEYKIMIAKFKDLRTLINILNEKNFKYSFEEILKEGINNVENKR